MNPYDEVHYPSHVFRQTHPDRLATSATLHGLSPAPPERCRMLDLGCGDGINVTALAMATPGSEFVGVDLAAVPVAAGNARIAALGLRNARLVVGDVAAPDPAWGTFDYVVSHGVYSWVPAPVRERLLATVAACLRPGGVGYVSYAANPGSLARHVMRHMLLLHTETAGSVEDRLARSYEFLRTLRAARTRQGEPWNDWLSHEIDDRLSATPGYLRHDDLAGVNEPSWFRDFAAHAARHGLVHMGDAEWPENSDLGFPPEVRAAIARVTDPIEREQYRDLLKVRRFRETLVVHREQPPSATKCIDRIAGLRVAGEIRVPREAVPLDRVAAETFEGPRTSRAATDSRIARAALRIVATAWPRRIPFEELLASASRTVADACGGAAPAEDERATLLEIISGLQDAGILALHSSEPAYAAVPGERPVATPLARLQAASGPEVVSLLQFTITLDDARSRRLVALLDGTVDRAEILRRLRSAEEPPNTGVPGAPPITAELLEVTLAGLARRALLMP